MLVIQFTSSLTIHRLPTRTTIINDQPPIIKPTPEPRRIAPEELQSFQNPDNLHGKRFILTDPDDPATYEVIGYQRARDKSLTFDILFEDCGDNSLALSEG